MTDTTESAIGRLTVEWGYGMFTQQHIRDANRAVDCPDGLEFDVGDEVLYATGTPGQIRWLYDYLEYLKRAWRQEGEQWDADEAENMAQVLWEQVGDELPDQQRANEVMTDGGTSTDTNQGLRDALADDLQPADDIDGLSRFCPHCEKAGIPSQPDYKEVLVECVTTECPVYYFRLDRVDEVEE
jgi:hypothetical protein